MGRKHLIRKTEWQPQIDRFIAAGWSSESISQYMRLRYGYSVESSSIRRYRLTDKTRILKENSKLSADVQTKVYAATEADDLYDVLGEMGSMLRMQRERLEIDLSLEKNQFNKLLPDTRHEIRLLADLMGQYHELLQDYGVAPKVGETLTIHADVSGGQTEPEPIEAEWSEFEGDDLETAMKFARIVHKALPMEPTGDSKPK